MVSDANRDQQDIVHKGNFQVVDRNFTITDNDDPTKKVRIDVSNVSAGNTRTVKVPDADVDLADISSAQTLTSKTIDGDDNTIQDLPITALKTVVGDANKLLQRDASGVPQSSNEIRAPLFHNIGAATIAALISLGKTAATGLQIQVLDEVVDLTSAGAKFVAMTTAVPSGAVILGVESNIDAAITAGGTSVKVGIGLNAGDVDKYGLSDDLSQNTKTNLIPDWTVLSSSEQIDVCAVVTDGSALGDTNFSAGMVRVRVYFLALAGLPNA